MEAIISDLVSRFEKGALTRRGLIQGLAMLTAAGGTAAVAQDQDAALKGVKIDHISIQVSDLARSVAFYENIFGLKVLGEDKPNEIARLGSGEDHRLTASQKPDGRGGSLRDRRREFQ